MTIDLDDKISTKAQLSYPAIGKGPFPWVLLVPGAGPADMNYTAGENTKLFWQISQLLSERGFVVLKYDKRDIGENITIIDNNLWGNMTYNYLKQDAQKAVNVLIQQPEVDAKKISLIGHSEGGEIVTRLAIDNSTTKFDNIVLMAPRIENPSDQVYYGFVEFPIEYAKLVLDKNHSGSFSLREALQDQLFQSMVGGNTSLILTPTITNDTSTKLLEPESNPNQDRNVDILTELKPILEKKFEKKFEGSKCENPMEGPCPIYLRSLLNLNSTLSIIGNVPSSTGILILHGQNDSGSRVQHAFLLQQKLFELNHPDHTLITYPDLGHHFFPSSRWITESGPIPEYVLKDLYSWLEFHSSS
ncbi:MAG TPA: alpha/beta fold hydrolase [Candidatus Nitrosocosmicus sp.]|nr:alpha/beta fold hydrolase [Candidatus Nitrosocosmicus sp.]